ncbi:MAG: metal-dependent phosphohydrolase, partial [Thermoguttaceae bacterium]|nr:metal-dependent phosphohydrolase [Thermoguttaceae bacterium]
MFQHKYQSETLVQDSIHGYIAFASPRGDRAPGDTCCERDLIDSPWTQRLRQIHQLQTAWLVYPT